MNAKDLRTESSLSERKDGSKYSASGATQQCNRNKTYQDIGTNPLAKAETAAAVRPCAVIGPDRVLPPPNTNDAYLKKGSIEPWPCPDNIYSQLPDYHHKMSSNPNQMRNISPRQTFQENMQRIMVPPAYNSIKNTTDSSNFNHVQDRAPVLSKNLKPNMASEAKYCDVPYTVNQLSNEHKSFRESEISVSSVNSPLMRSIPHGWSPNSGNLHASRTYGAHEVYQYQQYPNCVGPRPPILPIGRRHQSFQDETGYVYQDSYYQDPMRFKSYPQVKERYPQPRFDYISNYSNPYHPPPTFPPHKYDIPKPGTAHQYPMYPHLKYIDNRGSDPTIDAYNRPSNQPPPGYNVPFRNQVIHPTYPGIGNAQTKVLPYSVDSTGKPIVTNKLPYDSNKLYSTIDYDNARNKSYAVNDPYFLNEINRIQPAKNTIMPPNYPTASMHHVPTQQFLRKDIHMKSHEFMSHFRNYDPSIGSYTMIRHPSQFSPNTIAISPTDSNTSNDTTQTQGTNQEDCGYISQSSSASARSVESGINRISSEYYKRHDYRYGPIGNPHMLSKHEGKGKKQIDVRQFLQMWNEGDEDNGENNNKELIAQTSTSNAKQDNKQEQLYVLGLVNVPSEELSKYEHIQTVSKLPEHIKGYNSIELLKQYEEVVESSNLGSFKTPVSKKFHMHMRDNRNTLKQVVEVLPRPISPLDVEAKISQSVIHKEVGCNFEIKPCSPKMLNVEIPASVQNVLGERVIEKVSNPLSKVTESPISVQTDNDSLHNNLKRQTSLPSYEKSSCKILSSPFAPHNLDSVKTDYSIQDLEINSGVCLASLPRLDNEIELNFPEVNQQFIDANKIDNKTSKEKSNLKESNTVVELNRSKEDATDSEDIEGQTITFSEDDSQKEYTRLNKYRKSNSIEHENTITAVRTNSVIIKNPETLKNLSNSPRYDHSNFISEETHFPVNLTSHIDVYNRTKKPADLESNQDKTETYVAIDFSLNKNDVNKANKGSKKTNMRSSTQTVNEKNKLTMNNCFGVPSNDTKAHHKDNHFHESYDEADIQVTTNYKKESNSSSYLPNITCEEMDNLNEYSCKADFDDVMKKLTANDFEMTSEINLGSSNITKNSNEGIENINEQDLKVKCDIRPNKQFPTSQESTKHYNYDADITEKEYCNQQSIEHKKLDPNEFKVEEQIERKPHQKDKNNSNKDNLMEEYSDPSGRQSMEFEKLDVNKLTEEEKSVKANQLMEIKNFSINNLTEKDKTISTECETSNISDPSGLQSMEFEKLYVNKLTEEEKSVKANQLMEIENFSINNLTEKDKTILTECETSNISDPSGLQSMEFEKLDVNKFEEEKSVKANQLMEIENFSINNLTEKDKTKSTECETSNISDPSGLQSMEFEKLDVNKLMEEEKSVKSNQLMEIENFSINNLTEKDKTKSTECETSNISDPSGLQSMEFEKLDVNKFEEEKSVKANQLMEIENFSINNLTEKDKTKSTECETSNISDPSGLQSMEFEKLDVNKLTEEEKSVKSNQLMEIENFSINNLTEKDKTKSTECETSNISDPSGHQSMEFKKIDVNKLTEEEKSVEANQLMEIENFSINNLTETDKTISTECETSNIDTSTEEKESVILYPQQIENVNFNTDNLTEEEDIVKVKHLMEIENVYTNTLYEKGETKECNTFHLDMLIKEKQTEHEQVNTSIDEQKPKNIRNFDLNILTESYQRISSELHIKDSKTDTNTFYEATREQHNIHEHVTLDAEPLNEGGQNASPKQQLEDSATNIVAKTEQNTIIENPSQENINLNSETLTEERKPENEQHILATVTPLDKIKMNVVKKENHSLTPANSPLENETLGKDLLFENDHATIEEQHLEKADAITDKGESKIIFQDQQLPKNINLNTKMLVELQSVKINEENESVKTADAVAEEDQNMSQNSKPDSCGLVVAKNNSLDTEVFVEHPNVDTKMQHKDHKCVKTGATTEKDQSMTQNEGPQLSKGNSIFDTEMLVNQQNVETKTQHPLTEEDQSMSQKLQSEDDSGIDSVMPMVTENLDTSHAIEISSPKNEHSLEDCNSENSLNENDSVYLLENIPLSASLPIDSNDSKKSSQHYLSNRDEEIKHDIGCSFKLFKPVCRNKNSHYKMKLFSPQIQKLILHVDGFINSNNNNKPSETILSDTIFEEIETTNDIVDQESRIDNNLTNNSNVSFEVKTGEVTKETLERQSSDSKLLPPVTKGSQPVLESVIKVTNTLSIVNSPKSSKHELDIKYDSTKTVVIEPDSITTDEEVTSLIDIKNHETNHESRNANEQNFMVNECKEINADELSLSDSIVATPECENLLSLKSDNIDNHDSEINMGEISIESESNDFDRCLNHNKTDDTSEQNDTTFVTTPDKSFVTTEISEENVVYTFDKNIPEAKNSNQSNDSLKLKHISLKRSLSDSALNAYAQDNNRELRWSTKRRKIDENTLDQNIINESICRLIQASRRNSVSSFDNEENVSFCILIDDTCILTEGNAQDKICYAEVTESTENDNINQIEDDLVMGSPVPQNGINLLTTDTVIYECQDDDVVNEGPWVEDIACIETVSCENVEELVMTVSPSPKHGYNDTVISDNVAEDVVISSPSSIKCFEDDFVNVAPTFNHDWVETLVDDGVAEDVVISSFLTTKEDSLEGQIRTNLDETIANSPSNPSDWNETVDEDMGVGSVLNHREDWDDTFVDVNVADEAVANSSSSNNYDCLETRVKVTAKKNVPITFSPKKSIESEIRENVIRNTMDSPLTPKHNHSFKRVVKVTDVMITDSPSYSKDHLEYDDNELSCYNLHEHANKVKSIYGETMTDGDAQIVDTLFRTPQMDVNKTLLHDPLELDISAKLSHMEYSDDSSSESSHQKSSSCIFSEYSHCKYNDSDIVNRNTYQTENIMADKSTSHSNAYNGSSDTDNGFSARCIPQDKTVHSCESSADNVLTYDDSNYTSSSPEVSSTTSEERNSGILLKITNLNGSRISEINEIKSERKPRCKFTEKKDYSSNRFPNRPLITKAAQKYIPPVKESIRDLKVKISLPPQSLLKFKELKLSRNVTKATSKQSSSNVPKIPKKPKPLFEDVLKSIDEIQIKMHREKKKPKTTVPKVVIKKNEYGSHYASTPTKETFNPDLTGRKWQPWVFIERNNFIDKMALKNNTRAVFNHRKKCYVLPEKFKKYKSAVSNTKFVISRPSSIKSTGQLKYTIRLKHSY